MKEGRKNKILISVQIAVLVLSLCSILSGCRSVKYVPVEKTVTKTEYRDRYVRDTTYQRDSVYFETLLKGDTVYINKFKERHWYHEILKHDTVMVRDSIAVPQIREVEKGLSTLQQVQISIGKCTLALLVLAVGAGIAWLVVKLTGKRGGLG